MRLKQNKLFMMPLFCHSRVEDLHLMFSSEDLFHLSGLRYNDIFCFTTIQLLFLIFGPFQMIFFVPFNP